MRKRIKNEPKELTLRQHTRRNLMSLRVVNPEAMFQILFLVRQSGIKKYTSPKLVADLGFRKQLVV
jgi:hypothetical protein